MSKDDLEACTADDVQGWSVDGVARAARGLGLDDDDVAILKGHKVHGKALLKLTEEKLMSALKMPYGSASELAEFIQSKRSGAPPTPVLSLAHALRLCGGLLLRLQTVWYARARGSCVHC
jgi:hypothetical protein